MINITLTDNTVKIFEKNVTPMDVAKSISEGLARNVISASYNGIIIETNTLLNTDGKLVLYTWNEAEGKKAFWHSTSHVMAQVLEEIFPEIKLTLGELFMPIIQGTIKVITSLTNFVREHAVAIAFLGGTLAGAAGALLLYNTYLAVTKAIMVGKLVYAVWSLAAALEGTTVAQWLLNSATAFFAGLTGVGVFLVAAGAAAALAVGIYAAKSAQDSLNNSMEKQPSAGRLRLLQSSRCQGQRRGIKPGLYKHRNQQCLKTALVFCRQENQAGSNSRNIRGVFLHATRC
jgi:hypothetical protein